MSKRPYVPFEPFQHTCHCGYSYEISDAEDWGAYCSREFPCPSCGWALTYTKDLCDTYGPGGALRFVLMEDWQSSLQQIRKVGEEMAHRRGKAFVDAFINAK